jgi:hypothetical protein
MRRFRIRDVLAFQYASSFSITPSPARETPEGFPETVSLAVGGYLREA